MLNMLDNFSNCRTSCSLAETNTDLKQISSVTKGGTDKNASKRYVSNVGPDVIKALDIITSGASHVLSAAEQEYQLIVKSKLAEQQCLHQEKQELINQMNSTQSIIIEDVAKAVGPAGVVVKPVGLAASVVKAVEPAVGVVKAFKRAIGVVKAAEPSVGVVKSAEPAVGVVKAVEPAVGVVQGAETAVSVSKAVEPAVDVVKAVEPAVNTIKAVKPDGGVVKAVEPTEGVVKAVEPTDVVVKAFVPAGGVMIKAVEPDGGVVKAVGLARTNAVDPFHHLRTKELIYKKHVEADEVGVKARATAVEPFGVVSKAFEPAGVVSKAFEPAGVVSKAFEPAGVVSKSFEPAGVVSKAFEQAGVVSKALEPSGVVSKAVGAAGVVVNVVAVFGIKQTVLVKLSNISKECNSVHIDFGTKEICLPPSSICLQSSPRCLPSTPTFMDQNNIYTLAIYNPNKPIEKNTVVNVLEVSEERKEKRRRKKKNIFEEPVLVNLKVRVKSPIRSDKPIVVPVELVAKKFENKSLLKSGSIFIFNQTSIYGKFLKGNEPCKVMNHFLIAENGPSGTCHAQIVLCGYDTQTPNYQTLFSYGDCIGEAVLFDSSNPEQVQQCLASSTLQARV